MEGIIGRFEVVFHVVLGDCDTVSLGQAFLWGVTMLVDFQNIVSLGLL